MHPTMGPFLFIALIGLSLAAPPRLGPNSYFLVTLLMWSCSYINPQSDGIQATTSLRRPTAASWQSVKEPDQTARKKQQTARGKPELTAEQ